jgi:hypothetical protein
MITDLNNIIKKESSTMTKSVKYKGQNLSAETAKNVIGVYAKEDRKKFKHI